MENPTALFLPLISERELPAEGICAVQPGDEHYLVIKHQGDLHVVSNRCGHLGIPLNDGAVRDGAIYCSMHGFGFDLITGTVTNHLLENCDPIRVYSAIVRDGWIGVIDEAKL